MGFEIDFMPSGEGSRSSDAISFRYGNLESSDPKQQRVVVIDGGTKASGEALVKHITTYYHTRRVDAVLLTHPDADHASGLTVVIESLEVGALYMHRPWAHAEALHAMITDGRLSVRAVTQKLARSLANVYELDQMAKRRNIPVIEPFAGSLLLNDPALLVLGPDVNYYRDLACEMAELRAEPSTLSGLLQSFTQGAGDALARIKESLGFESETWSDAPGTSPSNNSSAILLFRDRDKSFLFTGDAGVPALTRAADLATTSGIALNTLHGLQVPHHGSRHNISPALLDRIKAPYGLISVCCDSPKHPSPRVTNALKRRGTRTSKTEKQVLSLSDGGVARQGYGAAPEIPFMYDFEE